MRRGDETGIRRGKPIGAYRLAHWFLLVTLLLSCVLAVRQVAFAGNHLPGRGIGVKLSVLQASAGDFSPQRDATFTPIDTSNVKSPALSLASILTPIPGRAQGEVGVSTKLLPSSREVAQIQPARALGFHIQRGDAQHFAAAHNAGASFVVLVFSWEDIEPTPGYFYWEQADAAVRAAAFYGIDIVARLDRAPTWALDASTPTPWNPGA